MSDFIFYSHSLCQFFLPRRCNALMVIDELGGAAFFSLSHSRADAPPLYALFMRFRGEETSCEVLLAFILRIGPFTPSPFPRPHISSQRPEWLYRSWRKVLKLIYIFFLVSFHHAHHYSFWSFHSLTSSPPSLQRNTWMYLLCIEVELKQRWIVSFHVYVFLFAYNSLYINNQFLSDIPIHFLIINHNW